MSVNNTTYPNVLPEWPFFRVTKQRDPDSGQQSLLFEIDYPEIAEGIVPRHRFMSAYEQKIEPPGLATHFQISNGSAFIWTILGRCSLQMQVTWPVNFQTRSGSTSYSPPNLTRPSRSKCPPVKSIALTTTSFGPCGTRTPRSSSCRYLWAPKAHFVLFTLSWWKAFNFTRIGIVVSTGGQMYSLSHLQ